MARNALSSRQGRIVGLAATCDGLHGAIGAGAEGDGEHCSSSVRMQSRTERVAESSGNSAIRSYPSPEQAAQLSKQIHLGRLGLFDTEDRCGRRCGFGGGRLGVAVEKFLQLLEIFFQRIEQIALV